MANPTRTTSAAATRASAVLFPAVSAGYVLAIHIGPAIAVGAAVVLVSRPWARTLVIGLAPVAYGLMFVAIAGTLSRLHAGKVVAGRSPRDTANPWYFHRRLYGQCWTSVYYFGPLYAVMLASAPTKAFLFRLFGYRGQTSFATYPDTWVRDLPLLHIGRGAYLSNRATLGTNMVMGDGRILVDDIVVGDGALVGHLAKIAPGVVIGHGAQVGVGVGIGIKTQLGDHVQVGPMAMIEHYVVVEEGARIGAHVFVGSRARIGARLVIPGGAVIPAGARVRTAADVLDFVGVTTRPVRRSSSRT
jgi:acetyltransferase-like isoleucine patch superfamily enzyme